MALLPHTSPGLKSFWFALLWICLKSYGKISIGIVEVGFWIRKCVILSALCDFHLAVFSLGPLCIVLAVILNQEELTLSE